MQRRDFLKRAAALPALTLAGRLAAAPAAGATRLLVVFLRGGYDAANVIIPVTSDLYYELRPTLAIAKPGTGGNAALRLDSTWGLHPALKDSVYPMFGEGQAAFVPFAGTDDTSRSHFETQDAIELGQPPGTRRDYGSGFLARLVSQLTAPKPIAFSARFPLIFHGDAMIPNLAVNAANAPGLPPHDEALVDSMYRGSRLAPAVEAGFQVQSEAHQRIAEEMQAAGRGAASAKGFSAAAQRVAVLMRDQFNLGFIDVGGWDTHVNEGGPTGYLASRLTEFGAGLAAFATEMGTAWKDTVVVVISEFGRTFCENGDRGTDHGHGSVYWVLGGSVRGGKMLGEQVTVAPSTLFQNRDYPVLNDFRAVLASLFQQVYGLTRPQIEAVFPKTVPATFAFV
jgi:uncharacterized protein (DUF1501 family)